MRYFLWILVLILGLRIVLFYTFQKSLNDGRLRITGTIRSESLLFERKQRIELEGYKVYLPLYPAVSYGDSVVVEGDASEGIIRKGKLIDLQESSNILYQFRERLLEFYKSSLPADSAALVAGTTIGSKQLLSKEFWSKLVATGTVHVVVASGMNVTIIAKFLLDLLLQILPRKKALPFAIIGIWLYVFLTGLSAPIVRAAIMGSLAFLAQETGKLSQSVRILLLTSGFMLFIKPEWLIDLSFLLSFTATLAILLLSKPIEQKLKRVPTLVRNDFSTSLAASVGTAPLIWWNFGRFNPFSPFINAAVLWTIAPITIIGGVGGIIGLVFPFVGKLLLYFVYPLIWWFISVVRLFS